MFRAAAGYSINFRQLSVHPRDYPSTFRVSVGPSVRLPSTFSATMLPCVLSAYVNFKRVHMTICQLSVHPRDIQLTFRASMGLSVSFHQFSVHLWEHASNFNASVRHSVNFPFVCGTFRQLWSTLRVSAVPSVNYRQHFVHPRDLLKRSVQLLDLPSTSVNYPCGIGSFCQLSVHPRGLQSTFCAPTGSSINFPCSLGTFRQHFALPWDLPSTSVNFPCSVGPSVKFLCGCGTCRQHSLWPEDDPSTFLVSAGLSINFRELSVGLYVNFTCVHRTVRKLPSAFHASRELVSTFLAPAGPSVNFC